MPNCLPDKCGAVNGQTWPGLLLIAHGKPHALTKLGAGMQHVRSDAYESVRDLPTTLKLAALSEAAHNFSALCCRRYAVTATRLLCSGSTPLNRLSKASVLAT